MKVLFCGHQKWAAISLEEVRKYHDVVGVFTETEEFERRHAAYYGEREVHGLYQSLKETAQNAGIPVFQPRNINDELALIEGQLKPDVCLSISYHRIIRKPLLDRFRFINLHNSLLPKYGGKSPIEWALYNGEMEIGVTAHYMDEGIDSGNIIVQATVPVYPEDDVFSVMKRCLPLFPQLSVEALRLFGEGYAGVEQKKEDRIYNRDFPAELKPVRFRKKE